MDPASLGFLFLAFTFSLTEQQDAPALHRPWPEKWSNGHFRWSDTVDASEIPKKPPGMALKTLKMMG